MVNSLQLTIQVLDHRVTFPVAQLVNNLPAMQETRIQFLGWGEGNGNPLQHSCGESRGQRSLAGYSPRGRKSRTQLSD